MTPASWHARLAGAAYAIGMSAAVLVVLLPLHVIRVALGRASWGDVRERLGFPRIAPKGGRVRLVVHAVSSGETAAAGLFLNHLGRRFPQCSVLLTTGNEDGRRMAARIAAREASVESVAWLPWDRRAAIGQWLDRIEADAIVTVEAELWPNLFLAARRRGLPVFVINGRLRPGDAGRYRLVRPLFREVLDAARWIGVQDAEALEAFLRAGAPPSRTEIAGNLKFAAAPPLQAAPPVWDSVLSASGPLVVCGSTHAPEEQWLLETFRTLRTQCPALRMVIAPRHTARAGRVQEEARAAGQPAVRWSDAASAWTPWRVLIVDEMGPLEALYRYATVVVIGGTLVARGGHNVLEPAKQARAIVAGPHVAHVRDTVDGLLAAGAICCLPDGGHLREHLSAALRGLLADGGRREEMGRRAARHCAAAAGVADRYVDQIAARLSRFPAFRDHVA